MIEVNHGSRACGTDSHGLIQRLVTSSRTVVMSKSNLCSYVRFVHISKLFHFCARRCTQLHTGAKIQSESAVLCGWRERWSVKRVNGRESIFDATSPAFDWMNQVIGRSIAV
jgi:hypothetical protein